MPPNSPVFGSPLIQVLTCRGSPPARMSSVEQQLGGFRGQLPVVIVDGYIPEDALVRDLYDHAANRTAMNRPLSGNEVAAYATHRKAWRNLLDSRHEACLVLEDDFRIADLGALEYVLAHAVSLCRGRDIVKLFDFPKSGCNGIAFEHRVGRIGLVRWLYPTAGAVAYLITRDGASKLLRRERIFRPVDEDIKYFWETGLDVWSIVPSPIAEGSVDLGGSLIDSSRKEAKSRRL